jgi:hypothetical protein
MSRNPVNARGWFGGELLNDACQTGVESARTTEGPRRANQTGAQAD